MTLNKLRRSRDPRCALEFLLDDSFWVILPLAQRPGRWMTAQLCGPIICSFPTLNVWGQNAFCVWFHSVCLFYSSSRCAELYWTSLTAQMIQSIPSQQEFTNCLETALFLKCIWLHISSLTVVSQSHPASLRLPPLFSLWSGLWHGERFPPSTGWASSLPRVPSLPFSLSARVSPDAPQRPPLCRGRHRELAGCQWQQHLRCSGLGLFKPRGWCRPAARAAAPVSHLQGEARGGAVWRGEKWDEK